MRRLPFASSRSDQAGLGSGPPSSGGALRFGPRAGAAAGGGDKGPPAPDMRGGKASPRGLASGTGSAKSISFDTTSGTARDGRIVDCADDPRKSRGTRGGVKRMRSSYQTRRLTQRTSLSDGTQLTASQYGPDISDQFPLGAYAEDYEYVAGSGDLDEDNGRFTVTPASLHIPIATPGQPEEWEI